MVSARRLYYLDDIPTPYRLSVHRRVAAEWPGAFRVAFCARSEPGRTWDFDFDGLDCEFLAGRQFRPIGQVNPFSFKWNAGVVGSLEAFRPDVVVMAGYAHPTMWRAARWCIANGVPYGITCETSRHSTSMSGLRWHAKRWLVGWMIRGMRFGLPVGEEAEEYLRLLGPTDVPMNHFPNTPDTSASSEQAARIRDEAREPALRARWGIPEDAVIFLFAGRLVGAKRPHDALEAFRRTASRKKRCLVVVGDGDQMESLKAAAAGDPRIIFTGWIQDPADVTSLMTIASALVLPSAHEPWGAVVNEAMATGTPVIASDRVGAARDLVTHGVDGYVVPVGDVDGLAAAMDELLADAARIRKMGRAAQVKALRHGADFATRNFLAGVLAATSAPAVESRGP